jgi:hypothetical protein
MFELFKEAGREIGEGAYMKKDDYIKKFWESLILFYSYSGRGN